MTEATDLASGKGHRDENFPVASVILKPAYRAPIMAFYRFARLADDIADNAATDPGTKLGLLAEMREGIEGTADTNAEAAALRRISRERGLDMQHGRDLLTAFERDARGDDTPSWDALIDYCRYSAMPVGRFVLDVHGEDRAIWPLSDALCAALQIINHLQDCANDYRAIGRVYLPGDMLEAYGARVEDLLAPRASPPLRALLADLALRAEALLKEAAPFSSAIRDHRLAIEVAIIHRLAVSLAARLKSCDPLADRMHHNRLETAQLAARAAIAQLWHRTMGRWTMGRRT
jgi:squalene synthase HpnC